MQDQIKILVVDDDKVLCGMLKDALEACDYACESAISAIAALDILKTTTFDVLITDVVMPGMDGLQMTEEARRLHPNIPVIVMTGYSEEDSYERAITAGAADFIRKPFVIKELLGRIARVLRDQQFMRLGKR